jgi:hypothetical protein
VSAVRSGPAVKRTILISLTGLVVVLLATFGLWRLLDRGERLADYYPLQPVGRQWEYVVREVAGGGSPRTGSAIFTALGPGTLDGKETLTIGVRREMDGVRDEVGVRVAVINHFTVENGAVHQVAEADNDFQADSIRYIQVVGRESVTVPAGRYDAIRVNTRTVTTREGSQRPSESTRTEWRARGEEMRESAS